VNGRYLRVSRLDMRVLQGFFLAASLALASLIGCQRNSGTCATSRAPASAGSSATTPSTDPAGQKFDAWLSALNAADRAALECLHPSFASIYMQIAEQTGGYEVHHLVEATRTERVALVRARKSGEWSCLKLRVGSDAPYPLEMVNRGSAEAPSEAKAPEPWPPLDDGARREVIDGLVRELDRRYVFPDKATAMVSEIRAQQGRHAYDGLEGRLALAQTVSLDLRRASNDRHVRLQMLCAPPAPPKPPADLPSGATTEGPTVTRANEPAALTRVIGATRRLEGNIAYVEIAAFGDHTEAAANEFRQAMNAAADASAIILDLRENGGGHEKNVRLVASYLFGDQPVRLSTIYLRTTNRTEDVFTDPRVPGPKFGPEKPVYILTSAHTFSAPESLAYDLQALKRAVVVGEVTGGGAHPGDVVSLPHGMSAFIPYGRPINPVTKTDWEGVGVKPDVGVPADKALEKAQELARARQSAKH
jgi:hypothetical protein